MSRDSEDARERALEARKATLVDHYGEAKYEKPFERTPPPAAYEGDRMMMGADVFIHTNGNWKYSHTMRTVEAVKKTAPPEVSRYRAPKPPPQEGDRMTIQDGVYIFKSGKWELSHIMRTIEEEKPKLRSVKRNDDLDDDEDDDE